MNGRRTMAKPQIRLVAYDIADSKRLRRVAGICLDYGIRVQKSLFECHLSEEVFHEFWNRLETAIDPEQDSLSAYPVCRACLRRRTAAGRAPPIPFSDEGFVF